MIEVTLKADPIRPSFYILEGYHQLHLEPLYWRLAMRSQVWRPPTDVYETEDTLVVRVEIAGMRESDISISMDDRYLSIRGWRVDAPERRAYRQMEIRFGEFITEVELPFPVAIEKIEAVYSDGFLRIHLPRFDSNQAQIDE